MSRHAAWAISCKRATQSSITPSTPGKACSSPPRFCIRRSIGCNSFVILQPFGCLPNHVVGRGIVKQLKERYPHANILPLDYDPDVSFANIENRLQMLVMSARAGQAAHGDCSKEACRG